MDMYGTMLPGFVHLVVSMQRLAPIHWIAPEEFKCKLYIVTKQVIVIHYSLATVFQRCHFEMLKVLQTIINKFDVCHRLILIAALLSFENYLSLC